MYPYLQVDRNALRRNASAIKEYVQVPVIGVVKSDGYGVSLMEAANAWRKAGVRVLAVSQSEDVIALRKGGFSGDILLLSPVADRDTLALMLRLNAILPVTSGEIAAFYAQNSKMPVRVHVAVDTGMGRFGIHWADDDQLNRVYETQNLQFLGIYSHFSASFEKGFRKTQRQLTKFLDTCKRLQSRGYCIGIRHIANSCAALRFPETRLDAVRIGSALVGQVSAPVALPLEPVAVCVAQVVDRKYLQPGDTTGYASVCCVKSHSHAIIVSVGHESGAGLLKTPDHYPLRPLLGYLARVLRLRFHPPCVEFQGHSLKLIGRLGNQFSLFDSGDLDVPPGSLVRMKANLMYPWKRREFI